jgi:hypothetical protein
MKMSRSFAVAVLALAALPALAAAETWSNAALVDTHCATKAKVAQDPDSHTRDCDLMCEKNGFGIFAEGKYYKFDAAGSAKAAEALKSSKADDHIRVNVSGELKGDTIAVSSLELAK